MKLSVFLSLSISILLVSACEKEPVSHKSLPANAYIADFTVATEQFIRNIPEEYIDYARNNFHIAYQHTSHGTHVSYGLFGLQDYKPGDEVYLELPIMILLKINWIFTITP